MQANGRSFGCRLCGAILLLTLGGCANFWDELTSREHRLGDTWKTKPPPLEIIQTTDDGQKRGQALAELKEPNQNGGTPEQQEKYMQVLKNAATDDREPYCRLCAIRALGGYKDKRAIRLLEDVYQQPKLPFDLATNNMIRTQSLAALEKNGDDESRHLLMTVAKQPGPSTQADNADRQQTQDEKLIAIRALGKYRHPECIETLVSVVKNDKDVAVRDRAHDSLELMTGRKLPHDPGTIQAAINSPAPPEPTLIQRVSAIVSPSKDGKSE